MAQPIYESNSTFPETGVAGERLVDLLYRNIRDYVMFSPYGVQEGRIYPHVLCAKFHATATPVREALARLAAEGFIESTPRRGFHVRRPSERQVTDLWQVREGLEVMAGELFISRVRQGTAGVEQLSKPAAVLQRLTASLEVLDGREHIELNRQFHSTIVELSGNELLVSMYRGIQMQLLAAWVKRGLDTWRARVQAEAIDHQDLLDALHALDERRYAEVARRHVETSLSNALKDLSRKELVPSLIGDNVTPTKPVAQPQKEI